MIVYFKQKINYFIFPHNYEPNSLLAMKRTKTPKTLSRVKKKPGPKSGCTPEVIQQAYKFALVGLTDWQIAECLNVSTDTITAYKKVNPEFKQALEKGRKFATADVADVLFQVALGTYTVPAVKFFKNRVVEKEYDVNGNVIWERSYDKIIEHEYTKRLEPDTKALIKILNTRERELWGEAYKVEHDHRHAHLVAGGINIHTILDQITDTEQYSDDELKLIAKLGLDQIVSEQKELGQQQQI